MTLLPKWSGTGGYIRIDEPDGPVFERETLQCVHCMKHWIVEPGSGRRRGFCLNCNGPTCGAADCETRCVPFEAKVLGEEPW